MEEKSKRPPSTKPKRHMKDDADREPDFKPEQPTSIPPTSNADIRTNSDEAKKIVNAPDDNYDPLGVENGVQND